MITEAKVREMYDENKKSIMSAVRKLPSDSHLEVAFYESGKVWISEPMQSGSYMAWNPDFTVQFSANKFMKYEEMNEILNERISFVELD